jgi:hypothetical protein
LPDRRQKRLVFQVSLFYFFFAFLYVIVLYASCHYSMFMTENVFASIHCLYFEVIDSLFSDVF